MLEHWSDGIQKIRRDIPQRDEKDRSRKQGGNFPIGKKGPVLLSVTPAHDEAHLETAVLNQRLYRLYTTPVSFHGNPPLFPKLLFIRRPQPLR
jgi:hypothetical protein